MKIISCHIDNFGKLQDVDFNFSDNLTSFCENNGFGKSTLADFIFCMLYGMDKVTKTTKEFLDRKHYYPYNNGKFGGNLVLSYKGSEYKIVRVFDKSSQTKDELKIYKDNNEIPSSEISVPGEYFFNIDKDSFKKLMHITSEKIEIQSTNSINNKLNNLNQDVFDESSFSYAIDYLIKISRDYNDNGYKNSPSKILKDKIKENNNKIKELENLQTHTIPTLKKRLKKEKETYNKVKEDIKNYETTKNLLEKYETYENKINDNNLKVSDLNTKYKNNVPSQSDSLKVNDDITSLKTLINTNITISNEEEKKLNELSSIFTTNPIPSEEELQKQNKNIEEIKHNKSQLEVLQSNNLYSSQTELKVNFSNKSYEDDLSKVIDLIDNIKLLDNQIKEKEEVKEKEETNLQKKHILNNKLKLILSLCGGIGSLSLLILIIGLIFIKSNLTLALSFTIIGGALLLSCIIIFLAFLLIGLKKQNKATIQEKLDFDTNFNKETEELINKKNLLINEINETFTKYNYDTSKSYEYLLANFEIDIKTFKEISSKEETNKEKIENINLLISKKENEVIEFLTKYYDIDKDNLPLSLQLEKLKNNINEYKRLEELKNKVNNVTKNSVESKKKIENYSNKYNLSYDFVLNNISTILIDARNYESYINSFKKNKEELEELMLENNLKEKPILLDRGVINELKSENENRLKEITNLENDLNTYENQVENFSDIKLENDDLKQKLESYFKSSDLLKTANKLLIEANENLVKKYIDPIKENFVNYAKDIEQTLKEKVVMNSNYEIFFERESDNRSYKHLSSGLQTICSFCYRIALIDNMYKDDKPFLILDDPFVFLDKDHLVKTKELVKLISKDIQLIYFTCAESRNIL